MTPKPKYACRACGGVEFITQPIAYDIYQADGDKLRRQKSEYTQDLFTLDCRDCGARAPAEFAIAAE